MLVRRTDLYHGHVARQGSAAVELLRFAQKYRNIVRISLLDALADIGPYEETLMEEYAFEFRVSIRSRPLGVEMMDFHVPEFSGFASAAHSVDQDLRGAGHAAQMYVVS